MISYEEFLQALTPQQAHMLAVFAAQQRIYTSDAQEAAGFRADMAALLDARLLWRAMPGEEWRDGQRWYVFDGQVDPVAAASPVRESRSRSQPARPAPRTLLRAPPAGDKRSILADERRLTRH